MPANPLNTIVTVTQEQFDHAADLFRQIREITDTFSLVQLDKKRTMIARRTKLINERQALLALNGEQFEAVKRFANAWGRQWKRELRYSWEVGRYDISSVIAENDAASLQQIRNIRGPQWLKQFRLPPQPYIETKAQTAARDKAQSDWEDGVLRQEWLNKKETNR